MSDNSENYHKKQVGRRLAEFRQAISKTQLELATELGINQPALSLLEKGSHRPSFHAMRYLIDNYNLNVQWLIAGKGPMFITSGMVFANLQKNEDYRRMLEDMDTDTDILNGILLRYSELKRLKILDQLKNLDAIEKSIPEDDQ